MVTSRLAVVRLPSPSLRFTTTWGWTDVTCSYLNSNGKAKWKKMARDAADTGTWVRNNASPTFINRMKPGIEDILPTLATARMLTTTR